MCVLGVCVSSVNGVPECDMCVYPCLGVCLCVYLCVCQCVYQYEPMVYVYMNVSLSMLPFVNACGRVYVHVYLHICKHARTCAVYT